jgi:hypothetical protein
MDEDVAACLLAIVFLTAAAACIGTGILLALTDPPPGVAQAMLLAGVVLAVGYLLLEAPHRYWSV